MTRPDYRLLAAIVAPLLIWPWIPPWDNRYLREGQIGAVLFFLLTPLAEEALFRGLLQGALLGKTWFRQTLLGFSRANLATSFIFAAAHLWQHPLLLAPGYFAVSLVLGYFRERYGGILVPVLLHSYYNLGLLPFSW